MSTGPGTGRPGRGRVSVNYRLRDLIGTSLLGSIGFFLGPLVLGGLHPPVLRHALLSSLVFLPLVLLFVAFHDRNTLNVRRFLSVVIVGLSGVLVSDWILGTSTAVPTGLLRSLLAGAGCELFVFGTRRLRVRANRSSVEGKSVLIVGAGEAGVMLAGEIEDQPNLRRSVVGFLDDDPSKQNREVSPGLFVLGTTDELAERADHHDADEIIIAMPSVDGSVIRSITRRASEVSADLRIVPGIRDIIEGDVHWNQIRSIKPEDLLGRETVKLDEDRIRETLRGRTVLVTGAAGSIGSHLVREVLRHPVGRVVGADVDESGLYELEVSELNRSQRSDYTSELVDVRNRGDVRNLMDRHEPDLVLHAAALKHVPMVERHAPEAVRTNLFGTVNLAEAALEAGVERFMFVSTDKAVEPRNAMGRTKRIGERLMATFQEEHGGTDFASVRFGNVLGSRGSVVPIFKRQIAEGGPVTVTDPEMVRYFMTPTEAVRLVLTATSFEDRGVTYVLDMGEPISVMDLAHQLIVLSGYEPETEIPIEVVGLREGETLREKLVAEDETPEETPQESIRKVAVPSLSSAVFRELRSTERGSERAVRLTDRLDELVGGS